MVLKKDLTEKEIQFTGSRTQRTVFHGVCQIILLSWHQAEKKETGKVKTISRTFSKTPSLRSTNVECV